MHEIWRNGWEASSAKALAERLGITRSSFYNAFGSREALFKEALDLYFRIAPDRVLAHVGAEAIVLPLLTRMFREVCRVRAADLEGRGFLAINCVAELVGVERHPRPGHGGRRPARPGPLREPAAPGRCERGNQRLRRPERKALALQNLLMGLNLMSKVVRSEEELWTGVKLTLQGLGLHRPGRAPRPRSRRAASRKATASRP